MKISFTNIFATIMGSISALQATPPEPQSVPVVVLGGGIGALTSAIYLGRAGITPVVIEGDNPGGLITQSHMVQNWPGEMEISGQDLAEKVRAQAAANGAFFKHSEVIGVDFSQRPYTITSKSLDSGKTEKLKAESVIIAMGTKPNFLGIPGEQEYWGRGVTNCAICDGALYRDQIVGVVGGGDAAVLEGLYLSGIAKEVHIFVRKGSFKAVEEKRLQALLEKPNVKVHYNTVVEEVKGNGEKVQGVVLNEGSIALDGLFLAIGSQPNSKLFKDRLALDDKGYIKLKHDQETSVAGVYAIGDIVDPVYKQAISAAGDGAKAAMQAQQAISDRTAQVAVKPLELKTEILPALIGVIEVQSIEQFRAELKASKVPVVVDFYATWCGPCKRIAPMLDQSANALSGKVKFLKVNVDALSQLSKEYGIRSMPTVLLFNEKGQVVETKIGTAQISDLLEQLERDQSR